MTITTKFNPGDKVYCLSTGTKELTIEQVETVSKSSNPNMISAKILYVMTDDIFSRYPEYMLYSSKQEMLESAIKMLSE